MIHYHENTDHWLMKTRQIGFHVPKINLVDELPLRSEIVECVEQSWLK